MEQQTIKANGLTFSYLTTGEGPLALCLHGFPDTPHTWSYLMEPLAQAGYRVVAPYMRGYPPTEVPANHSYTSLDLGQDVISLIEALGEESAVVIGHDWGAFASYSAANLKPERISKLVTVAIPHPRAIGLSLKALLKAYHFITFQFHGYAKWALRRNNSAYVDSIFRRWSPTWQFTDEDTKHVKEAFARPGGIEGALGYYWSFAESGRDEAIQKLVNRKTSAPTLCLVGEADGALDLSAMPRSASAFTGSYRYEVLPNVGHFLHRETPDIFAKLVLDFLSG